MNLRDEALLMLDKRGAVMETARAVSRVLRAHKIRGAVIGGVAVVLHGHVRTTKDVDVLVQQPLERFRQILESEGFEFNASEREFMHEGVPVHLVPGDMAVPAPREMVELEGVLTISLVDLINLKLTSGMKNLARAQNIADVVGLIRERALTSALAAKLDQSVRGEFKKLVKAVRS